MRAGTARGTALLALAAALAVGACSDLGFHSRRASSTTTTTGGADGSAQHGDHGSGRSGACACPARGSSGRSAHDTGHGAAGAGSASGGVRGRATSTAPATTTPSPPCTATDTANRFAVSYGPSQLDIYPVAGGCRTPVVVFVHGGSYCCGDKSNDIPSAVAYFHAHDYAVVSINYALKVPYPAFDDDVAAAISWVHTNASSFGGDGARVVLLGHSSAAEMAAEVGVTPRFVGASGGVRCVGALDGFAYDLATWIPHASPAGRALYERVYGSTPAQWLAASATTYLTAGSARPRFLVVGSGDDSSQVRAAQQAFVDSLQRAGVAVTAVNADSLGHGAVVHQLGHDSVLTPAMTAFLDACR